MELELKLLLIVGALFGAGGAVIAIATIVLRERATVHELWHLYAVEFLLVALVLIPLYYGGALLWGALALFAGRGLWELYRVSERANLHLSIPLAPLFLLLPLLFIALLRTAPEGFLWLFLVYAVVETNDAFATLFGKLIGRHHPFPRLSPRKSTEGLIGGVVMALTVGIALAHTLLGLMLLPACGAVVVILCGGLAGDLATSFFKRRSAIKDFPPLSRLHGGLLDIHDAFLVAILFFYPFHQQVLS